MLVKGTLTEKEDTCEIENPSDTGGKFTIKHVATAKLVKAYETDNAALTVDGEEGDVARLSGYYKNAQEINVTMHRL